MAKRSQYKMKYLKEWETDDLFKDWILPVSGDTRKAKCKYCEVFLSAHYAGVCSHASDKKHLRKVPGGSVPSQKEHPADCSLNEFSWLLPVDGVNHFKCTYCNMDLDGTMESIEEHQKSKEHQKNAAELECEQDTKSGIKYQKRWHMNPVFKGWLTPVEGDSSKARCSVCDVELRAHYKDLERHTKTKKHVNRMQRSNSETAGVVLKLSKTSTEIEAEKIIEHQPLDSTLQRYSHGLNGNKLKTAKAEKLKSSAVLPPECDEEVVESLLEMECEAVEESNFAALASEKQKSTKRVAASVMQNSEDNDEPVKSIACAKALKSQLDTASKPVDDQTVAAAIVIKPLGYDSLELIASNNSATTNATNVRFSEADLSAPDVEEYEPPFKQVKLEKVHDAEVDSDRVTAATGDDEETRMKSGELPMESDFDEKNSSVPRKKRSSNSNIDWTRYKKMYRREWELDPALTDWIAPVDGDRYKAACRLCGCVLRAHYTDLRQHRKTAKHTRNAFWHKNKSREPVVMESCSSNVSKMKDDKPSKESKVSACYMLSKSPWSRYRKRYRKQWESDPQFQGWIAPVPGDDTRARCKYCRILLRAHFADLKSHARTTKHANNIAYGQPSDDCLLINHPIFAPPQTPAKPAAVNRKKKSSSKGLPSFSGSDNFDLNRPDDSLTPIGSIVNLTSFGWGASAHQETTLILPKHVHLDENLAASLPKTSPGAMFRVKKEPIVAEGAVPVKKRKEKLLQEFTQEELNENTLQNLTRSVTLWEFLMMKVEKSHPNSTRPKLETVLLEFKALHEQVKNLGQEQLIPITSEDGTTVSVQHDVLVIESEELAQCLGVPVGAYKIKDPSNPRMTRNINLLSNAARRRSKHGSAEVVTVSLPQDQLVMTNSVQKFIEPGESEIQSLVIQGDQLQGVKFFSYDMDGQYADCSNLIAVNGHSEADGDVQLYALPVSEDMDPETINTLLMQRLPVTNLVLVKESDTVSE